MAEFPTLQGWYDSYNADGYYQIEVAIDDKDINWAWYPAQVYTWTDLFYSPEALSTYNSWAGFGGGIPQSYLLDRDGTVRKARYGGNPPDAEWRAAIEELLGTNFEA